jgi:hypothetical protein
MYSVIKILDARLQAAAVWYHNALGTDQLIMQCLRRRILHTCVAEQKAFGGAARGILYALI